MHTFSAFAAARIIECSTPCGDDERCTQAEVDVYGAAIWCSTPCGDDERCTRFGDERTARDFGAQLLAETMNGARAKADCSSTSGNACSTPCGDDERCTNAIKALTNGCNTCSTPCGDDERCTIRRFSEAFAGGRAQLLAETMNGAHLLFSRG